MPYNLRFRIPVSVFVLLMIICLEGVDRICNYCNCISGEMDLDYCISVPLKSNAGLYKDGFRLLYFCSFKQVGGF